MCFGRFGSVLPAPHQFGPQTGKNRLSVVGDCRSRNYGSRAGIISPFTPPQPVFFATPVCNMVSAFFRTSVWRKQGKHVSRAARCYGRRPAGIAMFTPAPSFVSAYAPVFNMISTCSNMHMAKAGQKRLFRRLEITEADRTDFRFLHMIQQVGCFRFAFV